MKVQFGGAIQLQECEKVIIWVYIFLIINYTGQTRANINVSLCHF